jgi:hypothetical protein
MNSTESKYNFYKKAFRGGAQPVSTETQLSPSTEQSQSQSQAEPQLEQQPEQSQSEPQQVQQTEQVKENAEQDLNELNKTVPNKKVDFRVSTFFGNLDQTLAFKQKINLDPILVKQLFK